MALTRPNYNNLNSNVEVFNDPITLLNGGSTSDDDVGFLINRANGLLSNVALYWNEATTSFVLANTNDTGMVNANIAVTSYANITVATAHVESVITTNGVFWPNGTAYSSGSTSTGLFPYLDMGSITETTNPIPAVLDLGGLS